MTHDAECNGVLHAEAIRRAKEEAWDEGADSVSYDRESRDFLSQPENPYRAASADD